LTYLEWIARKRKVSAGVLLYRVSDAPEMLLVHPGGPFWAQRDDGAWSIPKGGFEEGEDLRRCALRELGEELGPVPEIELGEMIELGSVRQRGGKVVHAWAVEGDFDPGALDSNTFRMEWPPRSGNEREFPEVDRAGWFEPEAARVKLIDAQAAFIDRLLEHLRYSPQ
jgi:predicted NUDIX family NTP pyrophosphohydrolase